MQSVIRPALHIYTTPSSSASSSFNISQFEENAKSVILWFHGEEHSKENPNGSWSAPLLSKFHECIRHACGLSFQIPLARLQESRKSTNSHLVLLCLVSLWSRIDSLLQFRDHSVSLVYIPTHQLKLFFPFYLVPLNCDPKRPTERLVEPSASVKNSQEPADACRLLSQISLSRLHERRESKNHSLRNDVSFSGGLARIYTPYTPLETSWYKYLPTAQTLASSILHTIESSSKSLHYTSTMRCDVLAFI